MSIGKVLIIITIAVSLGAAVAAERTAIAQNADLIVIGTLKRPIEIRRPNGVSLSGTIEVQETLKGTIPDRGELQYRFQCSCCRRDLKREIVALTQAAHIWFLIQNGDGWMPAGDCSDPGTRDLAERGYYVRVLQNRRAKEK
jgi:hypothetical protein